MFYPDRIPWQSDSSNGYNAVNGDSAFSRLLLNGSF